MQTLISIIFFLIVHNTMSFARDPLTNYHGHVEHSLKVNNPKADKKQIQIQISPGTISKDRIQGQAKCQMAGTYTLHILKTLAIQKVVLVLKRTTKSFSSNTFTIACVYFYYSFPLFLSVFDFCLSLSSSFFVISDTIIIGIFYCLKWPSIKYVPMQRGGESVQKRTGAYRRGDALWSVSTYTSLFCFFLSEVCRFYNTNRFLSNLRFILPYLIDFQELHRCRIRRQVFITLYRSHSSL